MAESGSKPEAKAGKENEIPIQNLEKGDDSRHCKDNEEIQEGEMECFKHIGEKIDVYCTDHDTVCCSMCIESWHSSCKNIKAIHEIALKKEVNKGLSALKSDLEADIKQLTAKKGIKQAVLEGVFRDKDVTQKQIRGLREKINNHLGEMERNSTNDADGIFQQRLKYIVSNITEIDNMLTSLNRSHKQITQVRVESIADAFIELKLANECRKDVSELEKKMEENSEELSLKFYPDRLVDKFLKDTEGLGGVSQTRDVSTATWLADVDVNMPDDDFPCEVSDFCQTNDGSIYMTDYVNMRLKKMEMKDNKYSIADSLDMPSFPWGVCQVDEKTLMVTLKQANAVLIVSIDQPMSAGSAFDIGDRIRGIAYHDGFIYVCCGGSKIYNEGIGRLEVYGIDGKILRAYYEHFACPSDVKISETGTEIYVSDAYNGLVVVDNNGHLLYRTELQELDVLCGICKIGTAQSCIAGFKSNNIMLVNEENRSCKEILCLSNGIEHPKGLHYNENESILFVSMGSSDIIKLFKLI